MRLKSPERSCSSTAKNVKLFFSFAHSSHHLKLSQLFSKSSNFACKLSHWTVIEFSVFFIWKHRAPSDASEILSRDSPNVNFFKHSAILFCTWEEILTQSFFCQKMSCCRDPCGYGDPAVLPKYVKATSVVTEERFHLTPYSLQLTVTLQCIPSDSLISTVKALGLDYFRVRRATLHHLHYFMEACRRRWKLNFSDSRWKTIKDSISSKRSWPENIGK